MRKIALLAAFILATHAGFGASSYTMNVLVSDIPNPFNATTPPTMCGSPATATCMQLDPHLIDGWGIAITASSPFWISNAGTGLATVYSYSPTATPNITVTATAVTVPSASGGAGPVTGQIAAGGLGPAFSINGAPTASSFMFCTQDGTISARIASSPNNAIVTVNNGGSAVYKGCAAVLTPAGPRFYAANFSNGTVDVFDANWSPVATGGGFTDPNLPAGLSPFNVQAFPGPTASAVAQQKIYVTYAVLGADGIHDQPGRGNGQVDVYDFDGNLLQSFSDPSMNSPWGVEIAPEFWGDYGNALLVGNFGNGQINAFDQVSSAYLGTLSDTTGKPLAIPGLWALQYGNGKSGGDGKTLYFTAGPGGEMHGVFGSITSP